MSAGAKWNTRAPLRRARLHAILATVDRTKERSMTMITTLEISEIPMMITDRPGVPG